jgi:predicted RNA-binding protein with PUA-like domain
VGFNFLEPMLFEQGLGTLPGWCDRLASDEPEAGLTSPTWTSHLWVQECGPRFAADTFIQAMTQHWLMKSEPDEASIDHLATAPKKTLPWTGVRNYQARNFMRDAMRVGDGVLFYHSSCAEPGVAGIAQVASTAYTDATQFDPTSPYFDPKAKADAPRWVHVDVKLVRKTRLLPLREMRTRPELAGMLLLKPGNRLSITPVTPAEWDAVMRLLA